MSADGTAENGAGSGAREPDPFAGPGWDRTRSSSPREPSGGPARQRVRVRTTKRRTRQRLFLGLGVFAILVVAAVGYLLVTGLQARTQLEAVRAEVRQLRAQISAGDLSGARSTAGELRGHAAQAHDLTDGPVWAAAASVPYVGDPAETVRTVTTSVDRIADKALPALVEASRQLNPRTLRRADGSIDLAPIERVGPSLDSAAATMTAASHAIDASPASTWLGTVNSARTDLHAQLGKLTSTVVSADVAARALPALFGADGPKSYFVSFQNEAELRGLGGLPGAFAILKADRGKISFTRFESDSALRRVPSGLTFDAGFRNLYGRTGVDAIYDPTSLYVNSDVSPHFPYAAQIWLAQWQHKTGQRLDGALTLDPTAVSYLLGVSGPAKLPDGTSVSAGNVVRLTQQTAYDRFASDNDKRKQFLLDVARAVSTKLVNGKADTTALVRAAAKAVGEHRLLVYSADPAIEAQLQRTTISGIVPTTGGPYVGLSLNNSMTGKLDYYLTASLRWRRIGCGSTREVTATITLTNHARADLPKYVLGSYGQPGRPKNKGDNQQVVDYFATQGALLTSAEVNGKRVGTGLGVVRSHPVFRVPLSLPRGVPQTIVLHLREPGRSGVLVVRPQPMIRPLEVSLNDATCD